MSATLSGGCLEATQIEVELSTDVNCADHPETAIHVGSLEHFESAPPVAVTSACEAETGRIGSIVVLPHESKEGQVGLEVVAGIAKSSEECRRDNFVGGCIVARRALHFVKHRSLTLPIELEAACIDVPCGATETCRKGRCVSAVVDPDTCQTSSGCSVVEQTGGFGGMAGVGGGGFGGTESSGGAAGISAAGKGQAGDEPLAGGGQPAAAGGSAGQPAQGGGGQPAQGGGGQSSGGSAGQVFATGGQGGASGQPSAGFGGQGGSAGQLGLAGQGGAGNGGQGGAAGQPAAGSAGQISGGTGGQAAGGLGGNPSGGSGGKATGGSAGFGGTGGAAPVIPSLVASDFKASTGNVLSISPSKTLLPENPGDILLSWVCVSSQLAVITPQNSSFWSAVTDAPGQTFLLAQLRCQLFKATATGGTESHAFNIFPAAEASIQRLELKSAKPPAASPPADSGFPTTTATTSAMSVSQNHSALVYFFAVSGSTTLGTIKIGASGQSTTLQQIVASGIDQHTSGVAVAIDQPLGTAPQVSYAPINVGVWSSAGVVLAPSP